MKTLPANKILLIVIAIIIIGGGVGIGLYLGDKQGESDTVNNQNISNSSDDFVRTGQNSFGLDVCTEMSKEVVSRVIGKTVVSIQDYSNNGSTGCQYYTDEQKSGMVIIDVGFGDMAKQKTGLVSLGYTTKTIEGIGLENFASVNDDGQIVDIYMNIAAGQKYVRVGRGSVTVIDDPTLIKLAQNVETKIRSYK